MVVVRLKIMVMMRRIWMMSSKRGGEDMTLQSNTNHYNTSQDLSHHITYQYTTPIPHELFLSTMPGQNKQLATVLIPSALLCMLVEVGTVEVEVREGAVYCGVPLGTL
jgi:hypothetical protein